MEAKRQAKKMKCGTKEESLTKQDLQEILSYLPVLDNKEVIELGAGTGRITAELAKTAKSVLALDFMEELIERNKERNSMFKNIAFRCADMTKMQLIDSCCDLVFSKWSMMYLEEDEIISLIQKQLSWLREGGYIFLLEPCDKPYVDMKSKDDQSVYRDPSYYLSMFTKPSVPTENDEVFGFEMVLSKPFHVDKAMNGYSLHTWLLQKHRKQKAAYRGFNTFKDFIDGFQYTNNSILQYEKIFGRSFISLGGIETTKAVVAKLDLKPGQVVLDVACGLGGNAFYMAKEFGVKVFAVDISSNMINIGIQRAKEDGITEENVQFENADLTKRGFAPESFDAIFSKDSLAYTQDKLTLFKKISKWLKVGGKLVTAEYNLNGEQHLKQFEAHFKEMGYFLESTWRFREMLQEAGFSNVETDDWSALMVRHHENDVARLKSLKDVILEAHVKEDCDFLDDICEKAKAGTGNFSWNMFYAEKW